ncbi:hypothetical protein DIPPA_15635 [Diplonema papillatum]|nr:hypothetical protein DIPPA_15635 [Diplonema papillatum]
MAIPVLLPIDRTTGTVHHAEMHFDLLVGEDFLLEVALLWNSASSPATTSPFGGQRCPGCNRRLPRRHSRRIADGGLRVTPAGKRAAQPPPAARGKRQNRKGRYEKRQSWMRQQVQSSRRADEQ